MKRILFGVWLRHVVAVVCLSLVNLAPAYGEQVPADVFAALPQYESPKLSPNGHSVAFRLWIRDQLVLIVQDITPGQQGKPELKPIVLGDAKVDDFQWASDDRLILTIRTTEKSGIDLWNVRRLVSIGKDGKDPVVFKMKPNRDGYYRQNVRVVSLLKDDPEHILVELDDVEFGWAQPDVHRVNIYTGKKRRALRNVKHAYEWIADENGIIRIGIKYENYLKQRDVVIFYRESEKADFVTLQKTDYFDEAQLKPVRFDKEDPNILLVEGKSADGNFQLQRYDLAKRELIGPYEDGRRKKILAILDQLLDEDEIELVSSSDSYQIHLARAYSDQAPPRYYLLNLKRKSIDQFAVQYPELEGAALAPMERIEYVARDGYKIPAFLTTPVGVEAKKLPLVVYPHGGPWSHDVWGFDNYVQFFANRGYAVLQPQFRGSTGYGQAHEEAGYRQWGRLIQDDITDGVHHLVKSGIVDPKRVCIVGASFGGYAAAMGAIRTPDLYRCAVSINGVMDLKQYVVDLNDLLFNTQNRAVVNSQAEAEKDSPWHRAEEVAIPILLIAGDRDSVVPYRHSRDMYRKLESEDKDVELITLEGAEHWRTDPAHERTIFSALDRFLSQHLSAKGG